MKKIIGLMIVVLLLAVAAEGQGVLKESNIYFGDKTASAWIAPAKSGIDLARKNIVKYTKKNLGISLKSEGKDIIIAKEIFAESISSKRGDLVIKLIDDNGTAGIGVAFMMGYDIALNTGEYPVEMGNLKLYVADMMKYHYKEWLEMNIDNDTKRISQVNKEIKKNERAITVLNRDITSGEDQLASGPGPEEKLKINNRIIESRSKRESLAAINLNLKNEITRLEYNVSLSNNELNNVDMIRF